MPTAPLYRRGDSVYLISSAELGRLEAHKIHSIKQLEDGRWTYKVVIHKKPPAQGLVGDTYDSRVNEREILFYESDFTDVCGALEIICNRYQNQVNQYNNYVDARCSASSGAEDDSPNPGLDEPKWAIGDVVYFDASARIGFIHQDRIRSIHEVPIQPGSRRLKYSYQLVNVPNRRIFFREDELISFCEAAQLALEVAQTELTDAEAKRNDLCA